MNSIFSLKKNAIEPRRMGLGLAALGRPAYINLGHGQDLAHDYDEHSMQARTHLILSQAYAKGIRYFDTARSYGKAEAFLASWLKDNPSLSDSIIGSKWGYTYTANWQLKAAQHEVKEHSLEQLNKQYQESQAYLGAKLSLYQVHSATLDSGVLRNQAVHEKLFELKQQGLAIGLSLSGAQQSQSLIEALKIKVQGERLFDSVQATFNVFERSRAPTLALAHSEGMFVIVKEALANGRLTHHNTTAEAQTLAIQAAALHSTMDALALAWVLKHDWVDVVLSGATTQQQLASNLQAFRLEVTEDVTRALAGLEQSPADYWQKRSEMAWN